MSVLEIQNLKYVYSVGTPYQFTALNDVSLKVEKGEMLAVIGHTGSGKSTLIQHFNGLFEPTEGKVFVDRISPLRKQLIKSKLRALLQGRFRCGYKTKLAAR